MKNTKHPRPAERREGPGPRVQVREAAPVLAERVNAAVLGALGRLAWKLATTH